MKNSELQKILNNFPDNYEVFIDAAFPWEEQMYLINPYLFIDTDTGQIEISVSEEGIKSFWCVNNKLPKANKVCLCKENIVSPIKICIYNNIENVWIDYNTFEKIQYEKIKYWAYIPMVDCE